MSLHELCRILHSIESDVVELRNNLATDGDQLDQALRLRPHWYRTAERIVESAGKGSGGLLAYRSQLLALGDITADDIDTLHKRLDLIVKWGLSRTTDGKGGYKSECGSIIARHREDEPATKSLDEFQFDQAAREAREFASRVSAHLVPDGAMVGAWRMRPFDPTSPAAARDGEVIAAVRKVVEDWDGDNWNTVLEILRIFHSDEQIRVLTVQNIRQHFDVNQMRLIRAIGGMASTATHEVHPAIGVGEVTLVIHEDGKVSAKPDSSITGSSSSKCTHSDDFTSVNWFGERFTFVKGLQAQAVKLLWEQEGHSLTQETIGERIGSSATRFELRKLFRRKVEDGYVKHPALGQMIQQDSKGAYFIPSRG